MDSKQAPPPYAEAANPNSPAGANNDGFMPPAGEPGTHLASYPPQSGYPAGYSTGYGQPPPPGYSQPPAEYAQPPAYRPQPGAPGGYAYQQTVVVNQPVHGGVMVGASVPDHMGLAIFTTICCCWPLGLVAIMRAQESRRALERGDIGAASTYSAEARRYSMWAIAGGCISIIIAVGIIVWVVTSNSLYY